jgi:hypothetical protein
VRADIPAPTQGPSARIPVTGAAFEFRIGNCAHVFPRIPEPAVQESVIKPEVGARASEARQSESMAPTLEFNRNPTVIQGGGAMAKRPTDFAQQNTERAFEVTSYSLNWMREMAERNLNQSKAALEDLLTMTRKAVDDMDHQAAVIREHSISLMEETLSNTFEFAHKLVQMKEPQELAQLQSEFVSRQAQVVGDQTKELGQSIAQGASEAAKTAMREAAESSRRQSAAA